MHEKEGWTVGVTRGKRVDRGPGVAKGGKQQRHTIRYLKFDTPVHFALAEREGAVGSLKSYGAANLSVCVVVLRPPLCARGEIEWKRDGETRILAGEARERFVCASHCACNDNGLNGQAADFRRSKRERKGEKKRYASWGILALFG